MVEIMAEYEQDPAPSDVPSAIRLQPLRQLVERHRGGWLSKLQLGPPLQLASGQGRHALPTQGRQLGFQNHPGILPARQHDHQWPTHPGAANHQEGIDLCTSNSESVWRSSDVIPPNAICLCRLVSEHSTQCETVVR